MGGLIGFELIRELRRLGAPAPRRLFITARQAPQLLETRPPLHLLPDEELFEELDRRYGGIPSEALKNPEIRDVFIPLLRADIEMIETYRCRPEEPLDCPISVFGGRLDHLSHADLSAWQEQTRQPVAVRMFEGSHFFIQTAQAPLLEVVGQQLTAE
jgi:medium-chain acyl-[acyl-carrier-protein] hydrolase